MSSPYPGDRQLLAGSAALISATFEQDGAYRDRDGRVTSEAQSYAMLRAVWSDDRPAFDRAWGWTQAQLIQANGLPAWLWQDGAVVDRSSAADADTDVALALLMAGRRWQAPALTAAGTELARAIWAHEVAAVAGSYYLAAGPWAVQVEQVVINPSYFAPYAYRIFQEVDPAHPWLELLDTGYALIERLSVQSLAGERPAGLPPDWVALRRDSGALVPAELGANDTTLYAYDAPRLYWRVALDLDWSAEPRARAYLSSARLLGEAARGAGPAGSYTRAGAISEREPIMVGQAGALAALRTLDPARYAQLYLRLIAGAAMGGPGSYWWGEQSDLYTQEWAWFAVAMRAAALPNLWHA